jgi:hypothetical protein
MERVEVAVALMTLHDDIPDLWAMLATINHAIRR